MTGAWGDDGRDDLPEVTERATPAKRFFYTDALAAAWMAKHFGMYFLADGRSRRMTRAVLRIAGGTNAQFYIHPDSLHLLEPEVGDWAEYQVDWKNTPHRIIVSERTKEELRDGRYPFSIKERKGVAFMWPESEDA